MVEGTHPDLKLETFQSGTADRNSFNPGQDIIAQWGVKNIGTARANAFEITYSMEHSDRGHYRFLYQTSTTYNRTIDLGHFYFDRPIISRRLTIPANTEPGQIRVKGKIRLIRPTNELNVTNNEKSFSIYVREPDKPDLVLQNARLEDDTLRPGQRFKLLYTVKNIGSGTFENPGHIFISHSLSDTNNSSQARTISSLHFTDSLEPGESKDITSSSFSVSQTKPPGRYYLFLKADDANIVDEERENNNTAVIEYTILPRPRPAIRPE